MNTDFFLDAPSPFVLLDAARAMDSPPGLTAWRRCEGVPFWQVLEAAAQAAALQQRVARDFSCHAFLLSVERAPWPAGPLSGTARLDVRVTAQGGSVAASLVRVRGFAGLGAPCRRWSWNCAWAWCPMMPLFPVNCWRAATGSCTHVCPTTPKPL